MVKETSPGQSQINPLISVIVLNYNGSKWIQKCIHSVLSQTIRAQVELIVADNCSTDGSDELARQALEGHGNAHFIQHGANLGFCEGNNRAALRATGDYLFFLNNDAWLEADCLEVLLREVRTMGASAGTPYVMNWGDDDYQWVFVAGYDLFGLPSFQVPPANTEFLFMPPGCSYLIKRELFLELGCFDSDFFMYADELDLSWRVWLSGGSAVVVPKARLHHRGAADVNPAGGERIIEFRTSANKRYYTNRNCLVTLLKNCRGLLLGLIPLQIALLLLEAAIALMLVRRWSFVRRAYLQAILDCWRSMPKIADARRQVSHFRKRGDIWMLRFLRLRLNRWDELRQIRKMGLPKVVGNETGHHSSDRQRASK